MRSFILDTRRLRWIATALVLLMCSINTPAIAQDQQPKIKVGDAAPDFVLKDQNGKEVSLKQLLEKGPAALVFYRSADW